MSKNTKTKINNDALIQEMINGFDENFTVEETKKWLQEMSKKKACSSKGNKHCCAKVESAKPARDVVEIVTGDTLSDGEIKINGQNLRGVSRAVVEYEAELGIPVMKLELVNPIVSVSDITSIK